LCVSVRHVCCVIDREGNGREALAREELALTTLFTRSELEKMAAIRP
jgi:orotate phosphoribosyltransferase